MDRDVNELLEEEIVKGFEQLNDLEVGTKEHKEMADYINQLCKTRNEANKISYEYYDKDERRTMDKELRDKDIELKNIQIKNDELRIWIELGTGAAGLLAWIFMNMKVMKFEETGTIRSKAFGGTFPKFNFWKK